MKTSYTREDFVEWGKQAAVAKRRKYGIEALRQAMHHARKSRDPEKVKETMRKNRKNRKNVTAPHEDTNH